MYVKKIFIKILFFLLFSSSSFACSILQVPIGTPVSTAEQTFDFLSTHNSEIYGTKYSAKYYSYAIDYCEGSSLENADLEVIVYDSKIAGINLFSTDSEFKNEIYEFVKNNISDPGDEVKKDNWLGYKDLSIGSLMMFYTKMKERGEIVEVLEITNSQMVDFTTGEDIIEVVR